MNEAYFLLLLFPYGGLLVWGLTKYKLNSVFGVGACVFTTLLVWFLLYLAFTHQASITEEGNPFQSIDEIMEENGDWQIRYLVESFGYLAGIAYFFSCWFICKKIVSNKKYQDGSY